MALRKPLLARSGPCGGPETEKQPQRNEPDAIEAPRYIACAFTCRLGHGKRAERLYRMRFIPGSSGAVAIYAAGRSEHKLPHAVCACKIEQHLGAQHGGAVKKKSMTDAGAATALSGEMNDHIHFLRQDLL